MSFALCILAALLASAPEVPVFDDARREFLEMSPSERRAKFTDAEWRNRVGKSYARIRNGEVFILGMNISPYEQGNRFNVDPLRPRRLLLHKREIRKLIGYQTLDGLTLVPLRMYINDRGRAKVELAVARGKKNYDKRHDIAKRDAERRMQQARRK